MGEINEKHLSVLAALMLGSIIVWLIASDSDDRLSVRPHLGIHTKMQTTVQPNTR